MGGKLSFFQTILLTTAHLLNLTLGENNAFKSETGK